MGSPLNGETTCSYQGTGSKGDQQGHALNVWAYTIGGGQVVNWTLWLVS